MAKIVYKDIKTKNLIKDATVGDIVRCTINERTGRADFEYRVIIIVIDLEQIKDTIELETFSSTDNWETVDFVGGINLITGELMLFDKEEECEIYKNGIIIDDSAF